MKAQKNLRSGLTLVELIVGIGLTMVVVTVLLNIFRSSYQSQAFSFTGGNLQVTARGTLDRINRQIRQATNVTDALETYASGNNELILQLPAIDANQAIINSTYDYVIYRLDPATPTKLKEIVIADASSSRRNDTRTILANVNSISFTYYNTDNQIIENSLADTKRIRYQINSSQTKYGKSVPITYSEQATLRNK